MLTASPWGGATGIIKFLSTKKLIYLIINQIGLLISIIIKYNNYPAHNFLLKKPRYFTYKIIFIILSSSKTILLKSKKKYSS